MSRYKIAFIDVETTGLDVERHEVWETGYIIETFNDSHNLQTPTRTYLAQIEVSHLGLADSEALRLNGFYSRRQIIHNKSYVADNLVNHLNGVYLAGCTIWFDERFLDRFLRNNGQCPTWDYHLIDCTTLAASKLGMHPGYNTGRVIERINSLGLGQIEKPEEAHTALGDAKVARDLYHWTYGIPTSND